MACATPCLVAPERALLDEERIATAAIHGSENRDLNDLVTPIWL